MLVFSVIVFLNTQMVWTGFAFESFPGIYFPLDHDPPCYPITNQNSLPKIP